MKVKPKTIDIIAIVFEDRENALIGVDHTILELWINCFNRRINYHKRQNYLLLSLSKLSVFKVIKIIIN